MQATVAPQRKPVPPATLPAAPPAAAAICFLYKRISLKQRQMQHQELSTTCADVWLSNIETPQFCLCEMRVHTMCKCDAAMLIGAGRSWLLRTFASNLLSSWSLVLSLVWVVGAQSSFNLHKLLEDALNDEFVF